MRLLLKHSTPLTCSQKLIRSEKTSPIVAAASQDFREACCCWDNISDDLWSDNHHRAGELHGPHLQGGRPVPRRAPARPPSATASILHCVEVLKHCSEGTFFHLCCRNANGLPPVASLVVQTMVPTYHQGWSLFPLAQTSFVTWRMPTQFQSLVTWESLFPPQRQGAWPSPGIGSDQEASLMKCYKAV